MVGITSAEAKREFLSKIFHSPGVRINSHAKYSKQKCDFTCHFDVIKEKIRITKILTKIIKCFRKAFGTVPVNFEHFHRL